MKKWYENEVIKMKITRLLLNGKRPSDQRANCPCKALCVFLSITVVLFFGVQTVCS